MRTAQVLYHESEIHPQLLPLGEIRDKRKEKVAEVEVFVSNNKVRGYLSGCGMITMEVFSTKESNLFLFVFPWDYDCGLFTPTRVILDDVSVLQDKKYLEECCLGLLYNEFTHKIDEYLSTK